MTDQRDSAAGAPGQDPMAQGRVVVVGPDGMAIGEGSDQDRERPLVEMVEQPAKVMRIGSMIRQLLEEVRAAPLDEQGRARLRQATPPVPADAVQSVKADVDEIKERTHR